ncbi:jg4798 [Pararge aegeria aegeria]|uniref:Jg4798 protein n=1 Tax=Pararge aegeria aegeria TaxID=348720 RepID=A0A8S4R031_9NEOP|nr:jg4798 [Pararge aegeria aegeria]
MMTPVDEKKDEKIRTGMVQVSDGKSRPRPARLVLAMEAVTVQREVVIPPQPPRDKSVPHARERMVQLTRQKVGGLGLSIKGGSEHKLPILISKIYKDQAADQTGQLFVGDAVIKVNGEYITACKHDDAVNILRNAGDIVVLTVKHYRAATPFLQKQADAASDTDSSTGDEHPSLHNKVDANCNSERPADTNGGWQSAWGSAEEGSRPGSAAGSARGSRPASAASAASERAPDGCKEWVDVVSVPLMMGYVTRYVFGTDKLRPGAFEKKTFTVVHMGRAAGLTLDWSSGFSLSEGTPGAPPVWSYRFSQLRGSSDDGKSKLKLHFQDTETKVIETKELECQILQSLLFCMHAFLTAKVASVDPAFLASIQQAN